MRSLPNVAPKPRILICAPSNAAADELLQRIMTDGFHDVQVHILATITIHNTLFVPHLPSFYVCVLEDGKWVCQHMYSALHCHV